MNEPTRQAALEAFGKSVVSASQVHATRFVLFLSGYESGYKAALEQAAQKLRAHAKNQTYTAPSGPYEHAANLIEDMASALANESSGKGEKG